MFELENMITISFWQITFHYPTQILSNHYFFMLRFADGGSWRGRKVWTRHGYQIEWWTCVCWVSRGKWLSACSDRTYGHHLRGQGCDGRILPDLFVVSKYFAFVRSILYAESQIGRLCLEFATQLFSSFCVLCLPSIVFRVNIFLTNPCTATFKYFR